MPQALEEQRKEKFREVLQQTYVGCVFDIDGTLTVRGDEFIPAFMHEPLGQMCMRIPMAVCSARKLMHAYEKMAPVFTRAPDPFYCQSNWVLICENGSIGYYFDSNKKEYVEFFRVPYPYPVGHRDSLFSALNTILQGKISVSFLNEVSMIFRPLKVEDSDRNALASRSREMALIIHQEVQKVDPKGVLKIGDSGIGVIVFPYEGNKERGTQEFAKYLRKKRGVNISLQAKELVVIGDQPGPHGNDETFLDGRFGIPFTVGEIHPEHILPLPVYDPTSGVILKGPEGTVGLLQQLKFRS